MRRFLLYASVLATLLAFPATPARGQVNFRTMVTFGDSLTHNDLLFLVDGRPRALYGKDAMEAVFRKGAGPGDDLISYAIAGLESDDVQNEIYAYELARLFGFHREATLIGFEIGSNDVLRKVDLLAAHPPGENALADRVIDSLISNMRRDFEYLVLRHPNATFILWTIPDITLTPRLINDLSDRQRQNVREHVERVNRLIRSANQFRRIVVLDLYRILQENVALG